MFKKLRNKMLMMNMISTFCLIVAAFSVIYAITSNDVETKIEQSLFRSLSFHRPMHWQYQPESSNPHTPLERNPSFERELRDMRSFSVFVDNEGSVHTDSIIGENSEYYEAVATEALRQNSSRGEFESEGITWRFVTRKLKDEAKIIALVDINAEKSFLRLLVISFVIGALVLLILIFFISLNFANRSIKPITDAWNKQKQFVADASHELKTPLAAINTNIDVLLTNGEKSIRSEEKWLRYIKNEVNRLSELSGNLLLMARLDSDLHIEREMKSVSEIVEETVLSMEAVAFERGTTLDYEIEKDIIAKVNGQQITRLCLILLDNAIKYSPSGDKIHISLKNSGKEQAVLTVKNGGEPIAEEELEKIFDRFYRVDKSRSTSGYGLGLAMAKEIVNIHKGKITVKSEKENGTEFTVTLPL